MRTSSLESNLDQMGLYILLPVHNRCQTTVRFAENLRAQTIKNFILILIDDGSSDGTADAVLKILPNTIVLRGTGRWWWGGSLDQGVKWLKKADVDSNANLLIINDDVTFDSMFLENGLNLLKQNPEKLYLASCYDEDTRELVETGVHFDWHSYRVFPVTPANRSTYAINCLSTRGLFLKVSTAFKTGGFYPRILPHYLSDYEFTMRAQAKGFELDSSLRIGIYTSSAASGAVDLSKVGVRRFLKSAFSIRSYGNPIHKTAFVLLAAPRGLKFKNLLRTWRSFTAELVDQLPTPARKTVKFMVRAARAVVNKPPRYLASAKRMNRIELFIRLLLMPLRPWSKSNKSWTRTFGFRVWDLYAGWQVRNLDQTSSQRFVLRGFPTIISSPEILKSELEIVNDDRVWHALDKSVEASVLDLCPGNGLFALRFVQHYPNRQFTLTPHSPEHFETLHEGLISVGPAVNYLENYDVDLVDRIRAFKYKADIVRLKMDKNDFIRIGALLDGFRYFSCLIIEMDGLDIADWTRFVSKLGELGFKCQILSSPESTEKISVIAEMQIDRDKIADVVKQFYTVSYAQEGEDIVLERIFYKPEGFFVDVGAHHPVRFSNTYHFYQNGWRGINIDANSESLKLFERFRPRDINVHSGVGTTAGILDFYEFDEPALNTFSPDRAAHLEKTSRYRIARVVKVPIVPLSHLLDEHLPLGQKIDFLTVDVEGFDLAVLESNDWGKYRPEVVLVEDLNFPGFRALADSPVTRFLESKGYDLLGKTVNTLFFRLIS